MKRNYISDKLEELYRKEQYSHPLQTRPKPGLGITGEKPKDYEDEFKLRDEEDLKKDIGKGSKDDLGKGTKNDLGQKEKSRPKHLNFKGVKKDASDQEN